MLQKQNAKSRDQVVKNVTTNENIDDARDMMIDRRVTLLHTVETFRLLAVMA